MPANSTESAGAPLAFRATGNGLVVPAVDRDFVSIRTVTRALSGMQKEALVASSTSADVWRLICDEGPYLNGTDLAPPPLAYFSAGMVSCYVDALQQAAKEAGTLLRGAHIVQDNHYSMEGSAIRGTMIAGAMPVELSVQASFENKSVDAEQIVQKAVSRSPIDALMRDALVDTFSIVHNDSQIPSGKVATTSSTIPPNPATLFSDYAYDKDLRSLTDVIAKLESTDSVFETDHGTGAAMKEQQKRQLHIRSLLTVGADGLREIRVQIFKPIGSVFQFYSGEPDDARVPSGLTLASAGLAFCFMTQIGRYAGIVKKDLSGYGVVQDSLFDIPNGKTLPIDTHAFISSTEDSATVQRYIDMAEQTCFLHGACRMSNKTKLMIA